MTIPPPLSAHSKGPSRHHSSALKLVTFVIAQVTKQVAQQFDEQWWMGPVVFCEGGARDQRVNTMFQVSHVDDGCPFWVDGGAVTHVVRSLDGMPLNR